jgi:hypothetical protein
VSGPAAVPAIFVRTGVLPFSDFLLVTKTFTSAAEPGPRRSAYYYQRNLGIAGIEEVRLVDVVINSWVRFLVMSGHSNLIWLSV